MTIHEPASATQVLDDLADLPELWRRITQIALQAVAGADQLFDQALTQSQALFEQYLATGTFKQTLLSEALGWDDLTGMLFFNRLYQYRQLKHQAPPSPVAHESSPAWMQHADYCFINVRATGRFYSTTGNFIEATRLLPILRVRALHLAPFFESVFGIVYTQDSFSTIADEVTNPFYEAHGIDRNQQLRYFIDCCHLLNMAVGFDLTPHTSGFSKIAFDRPELFRWVRFSHDYQGLANQQTIDQQYAESQQVQFIAHIRQLMAAIYAEYQITNLDDPASDLAQTRAAFRKAKLIIRAFGYYPVVPHTWNGVGLPGIQGYNHAGHYPIWDYRDEHGVDQAIHAMGMHSSFKFHTGLNANRLPTNDQQQAQTPSFAPTVEYLAELFPLMHQRYGFDFLRIDYVDHIWRSSKIIDGQELVLCEQITPKQLSYIAQQAQTCFPACGMLADHVGYDIDQYRQAGFSLILGREVQYPLDREHVYAMFDFNYQLQQAHQVNSNYGTAVFPIDTHDMGHAAFYGRDLVEREDQRLISLRHFFARFASCGAAPRPKYEVIGNQDGSRGIYRVNNQVGSLDWGNNRLLLAAYHAIEDTFEACRAEFQQGLLGQNYLYDHYCWWQIDDPAGRWSYLILTWLDHPQAYHGSHYHVQIATPWEPTPLLGLSLLDQASVELPPDQLEVRSDAGLVQWRWPAYSSWLVRLSPPARKHS